jgi:hypothetical protein
MGGEGGGVCGRGGARVVRSTALCGGLWATGPSVGALCACRRLPPCMNLGGCRTCPSPATSDGSTDDFTSAVQATGTPVLLACLVCPRALCASRSDFDAFLLGTLPRVQSLAQLAPQWQDVLAPAVQVFRGFDAAVLVRAASPERCPHTPSSVRVRLLTLGWPLAGAAC